VNSRDGVCPAPMAPPVLDLAAEEGGDSGLAAYQGGRRASTSRPRKVEMAATQGDWRPTTWRRRKAGVGATKGGRQPSSWRLRKGPTTLVAWGAAGVDRGSGSRRRAWIWGRNCGERRW
jgi:hypothetical protein